jgi:hypothetical protein
MKGVVAFSKFFAVSIALFLLLNGISKVGLIAHTRRGSFLMFGCVESQFTYARAKKFHTQKHDVIARWR